MLVNFPKKNILCLYKNLENNFCITLNNRVEKNPKIKINSSKSALKNCTLGIFKIKNCVLVQTVTKMSGIVAINLSKRCRKLLCSTLYAQKLMRNPQTFTAVWDNKNKFQLFSSSTCLDFYFWLLLTRDVTKPDQSEVLRIYFDQNEAVRSALDFLYIRSSLIFVYT